MNVVEGSHRANDLILYVNCMSQVKDRVCLIVIEVKDKSKKRSDKVSSNERTNDESRIRNRERPIERNVRSHLTGSNYPLSTERHLIVLE